MKDENSPVTPEEFILRRIHSDHYATNGLPVLSRKAFLPLGGKGVRHPDNDGISFTRLHCLDKAEEALAKIKPDKLPRAGLVQVQVLALASIKLTAIASPQPESGLLGHCHIPEINFPDYIKPEFTAKIDEYITALTSICSQLESIVVIPPILEQAKRDQQIPPTVDAAASVS